MKYINKHGQSFTITEKKKNKGMKTDRPREMPSINRTLLSATPKRNLSQ